MLKILGAAVGLIISLTVAYGQKAPKFYGVYAVGPSGLIKLNGRPQSELAGNEGRIVHASTQTLPEGTSSFVGAVAGVVGIRRGAISGNMKVSFQAARSIG